MRVDASSYEYLGIRFEPHSIYTNIISLSGCQEAPIDAWHNFDLEYTRGSRLEKKPKKNCYSIVLLSI